MPLNVFQFHRKSGGRPQPQDIDPGRSDAVSTSPRTSCSLKLEKRSKGPLRPPEPSVMYRKLGNTDAAEKQQPVFLTPDIISCRLGC